LNQVVIFHVYICSCLIYQNYLSFFKQSSADANELLLSNWKTIVSDFSVDSSFWIHNVFKPTPIDNAKNFSFWICSRRVQILLKGSIENNGILVYDRHNLWPQLVQVYLNYIFVIDKNLALWTVHNSQETIEESGFACTCPSNNSNFLSLPYLQGYIFKYVRMVLNVFDANWFQLNRIFPVIFCLCTLTLTFYDSILFSISTLVVIQNFLFWF